METSCCPTIFAGELLTRRRQIKETLTAHLVAWRELDERPPSSRSETLSNCRNSLVYCPDQCSSSLWWPKLSVIGSDRWFLADFRGQVVADSRLPPSSGHLLQRGIEHIVKGSRRLEGHVPQGRDLTSPPVRIIRQGGGGMCPRH